MCGIVGFIQNRDLPGSWDEMLKSMANQITHRGPDSDGIWFDIEAGIGLAHRRLAIIDLSPKGYQPMLSGSGRYIIVFNGEIYNFHDLIDDLTALGYQFRGHSDTEVILTAIEQWGVKGAVSRFIGMFAFALWDRVTRRLYLVRDRLGEKPLYYGKIGKTFVFGSELKALKVHPQWEGEIDNNALTLYMKHGYIPTPHSIYKGIKKLTPGAILTVDISKLDPTITETIYWSLDDVAYEALTNPFIGSVENMITGLEHLLLASVKQQMVADVPLGAFLSGGIDSSTVVALMQSLSLQPVKTFSIGFEYDGYDEAEYAREIANYLSTDHTELYVTSDDAINIIPKLPLIYDEPFSDSSQIPTYLISELARRNVTVSLSGDGGDELFCGYTRYLLVDNIWKKVKIFPYPIRRLVSKILTITPVEHLDLFLKWLNPLFSKYSRPGHAGDKIRKAAYLLDAKGPTQFYNSLTTIWNENAGLLKDVYHDQTTNIVTNYGPNVLTDNFIKQMMYMDTIKYLPDDILVKVDRASMANSLESRIPLLNHQVVEYAWRLPLSVKYKNGQGKWILRQILNKYVPEKYFERPKMGFGVPIGIWLSGPLKEWADELLDENLIRQQGYFNAEVISNKWKEHQLGIRNWHSHLWSVLVFQSWLQNK